MLLTASSSTATPVNIPSPGAAQRTDPAKSDVSAPVNTSLMNQRRLPVGRQSDLRFFRHNAPAHQDVGLAVFRGFPLRQCLLTLNHDREIISRYAIKRPQSFFTTTSFYLSFLAEGLHQPVAGSTSRVRPPQQARHSLKVTESVEILQLELFSILLAAKSNKYSLPEGGCVIVPSTPTLVEPQFW